MSYVLVMNFTKEVSSFMSLLASVVFNNSCEIAFNGLNNEISEAESVLNKKQ